MPKPRPKSKGIKVDFTGVEAGGRAVPDGRYVLSCTSVTLEESESSEKPYLAWKWRVDGPICKGAIVYDNTSLQPQALWRLRGLLEAMGEDIEDGEMNLELGEYVGRKIGAEITNEEYKGKQKPRITSFDTADSIEGGEEEGDGKTEDVLRVGTKVSFKDDEGATVKGIVTAIDGDMASVDVKGDEWDVEISELTTL